MEVIRVLVLIVNVACFVLGHLHLHFILSDKVLFSERLWCLTGTYIYGVNIVDSMQYLYSRLRCIRSYINENEVDIGHDLVV